MKPTSLRRLALRAVLAALIFAPQAQAQPAAAWPDKPIKLVVPYPPGGLTDTLARAVAEPLSKALGQTVFIDNKAGAGTLLGAQVVARSPADGYTLLMATSTTLGVSPALYRNNMIDPVRDFTPVSLVASVPFFLVVSPDAGWNSVQDVVDAARKASAPLQYGSAGNGSPHHLAMEMLQKASGAKFDHIPYKGSQLAIPDLLSGRFKLMITDLTPALGHIRAGKLKVLATTAPQRSGMMPDAPTFAEAGMPGVEAVAWQGIVAPAGTPKAVIDRLAAEIGRIVTSDTLKTRCAAMGCDALIPTSPADFAEMVKRDLARWTKVVNDSGAQVN
ncbi:MAG TPA: tripartite tricarboxylate transporter substrate binding protein [Ramlibacter sp.]|nr:tripartite tricarboxylate transporter substrate binding protein [Ramlibacter sp.]